MVIVDYPGLSDVEREFRRLKDEKREGEDGMKGVFSKKPFLARLKRSFDLLLTSRGIGWAHQPSALPPAPTCTRKQFIATRLLRIAFYVVLDAAAQTMTVHNPVLMSTTLTSLVDHGLYYRVLGILGFAGATYARINGLFCFAGILSGIFGFSEPKDWPNLYGGLVGAWSMKKFWGRT
ncbi:hypothetical protein BDQ12DRAFT_364882 [Crucibulum laeve]|uniref:Uncharacterized protein n=1 Tax=Crucibulum laeve TaxID=68775 RepID=A0A5C3LNT6_9AGAR|nr:hypothetical protein BDQ12DRAFT_364882 [Crucibulum laeve]